MFRLSFLLLWTVFEICPTGKAKSKNLSTNEKQGFCGFERIAFQPIDAVFSFFYNAKDVNLYHSSGDSPLRNCSDFSKERKMASAVARSMDLLSASNSSQGMGSFFSSHQMYPSKKA